MLALTSFRSLRSGGVQLHRGDAEASCQSAGMETSIPHGDDELAVGDRERAGEMYGVSAPQGMLGGENAGVTLDRRRQLDRPRCGPELLPARLGLLQAIPVEVVVPVGGSQSRSYLWV